MIKLISENPKLQKKIAESSPKYLFYRFSFWRYNLSMILLIFFSIGLCYYLLPLTFPNKNEIFSYISLGIYLFVPIGIKIVLKILGIIEVESAICEWVKNFGDTYLKQINSGQKVIKNLDEIELNSIPNNNSQPTPTMINVFRSIYKDAHDRKFESRIELAEHPCEELDTKIDTLISIQRLALRIGILGTFVGLILAISRVNTFFDVEIIESADVFFIPLINALKISFSTSVAGLVVSILVAFFMFYINRKRELYLRTMDEGIGIALSMARNSYKKDTFTQQFDQMNSLLEEVSKRIYSQTAQLDETSKSLSDRINLQTTEIQKGINKLSKANTEFDTFLNTISEKHNQFIEDVKSVYEIISLKNIVETIKNSITTAGKEIADKVNPNVSLISEHLEKYTTTTDELTSDIRLLNENLSSQIDIIDKGISQVVDIKENTNGYFSDLKEGLMQFINDLKAIYNRLTVEKLRTEIGEDIIIAGENVSKMLKTNIEETVKGIENLNNSLDKLDKLTKSIITKRRKFKRDMTKPDGVDREVGFNETISYWFHKIKTKISRQE